MERSYCEGIECKLDLILLATSQQFLNPGDIRTISPANSPFCGLSDFFFPFAFSEINFFNSGE